MSKTIYAVIAIVVLVLGGFWLFGSSAKMNQNLNAGKTADTSTSKEAPAQNVPVETKTISFTGSSFSPQFISVKLGDTVTFVNNSTVGMWIASAPHPTHTDYPEFDDKKALNPGESYTFTFTKAGTWKFHNHLNATYFGSVTVK